MNRISICAVAVISAVSTSTNAAQITALKAFSASCLQQIKSYDTLKKRMLDTGWVSVSETSDAMLSRASENLLTPRTFGRGEKVITVESTKLDMFEKGGANGKLFSIINRLERGADDVLNGCHVYDFKATSSPSENAWDSSTLTTIISNGSAPQYLSMTYHLYSDRDSKEAVAASGFNVRIREHEGLKGLILRASGFAE